MGKAKRFNIYDKNVETERRIAENYGMARQNLTVGSSFGSAPLSPPTHSGNYTNATSGGSTSSGDNLGNHIATDNLDMKTYNIQGVDQLIFSITASSDDVLANTDYGIEADGGTSPIGIRYNVPTGKEHIFYVNGTSEMEIGTVIDVKSNKIINLSAPTLDTDGATKKYVDDNAGGISNPVNAHLSLGGYQLQRVTALYLDGSGDNDHSIDGQTTGIAYNVDSVNDYHIFNIDEVEKFRIDIPHIVCRETLSMDDNSIQDVSQIYMNSSGTNDSWINPHSTGISFQVATGDQFNFQINSVTKCTIDSGSVTHSNFIVTESIFSPILMIQSLPERYPGMEATCWL